MAEFTEVMRQWGRLCNQHWEESNNLCDNCVISDICDTYAWENAENAEAIENAVVAWAKEHPEPVYPTWFEWLKSVGALPMEQTMCHRGLEQPIPADIAKKLGIEPKEG